MQQEKGPCLLREFNSRSLVTEGDGVGVSRDALPACGCHLPVR